MTQRLLWIAVAGALGALARYGLGGWVHRMAGPAFPWGTLVINGSGCLLFGLAWSMAEERFLVAAEFRTVVLVGFLGAFTTFSSYAFETGQMLRDSEWLPAILNILLQNILGLLLLFLGHALGRAL